MKKILFIIALMLLVGSFQIAESISSKIPSGSLEGGILHKKILSKYSSIDKFYYEPILAGGISSSPMIHLFMPEGEWQKLPKDKRSCIKAYAMLATISAKNNPLKYSDISSDSPIANKILNNARFITNNSWVIYEGKLTNNGCDIFQGKVVAQGK